jgi:predicted SAM-dependent methyltransferase
MKELIKNAARPILKLPLIGPGLAGVFARLAARPLISRYLRTHEIKKLHLGGAGLSDWLNSDLCPNHWKTVRLDATKPFPLPDASFSFVFSEHMIEHVPLAGARRMLAECHRVLRSGGRIRLATPDLARVVRIHAATDPTTKDYLHWAIAHNHLPADLPADAVVINSLFHDHGHQFLFDEPTLTALLRTAGFEDVRRWAPGESEQPELTGLEMHHHVVGHAANNFETLVLEARKP